jgi:membrane-bound lytic murein transglycosylase D
MASLTPMKAYLCANLLLVLAAALLLVVRSVSITLQRPLAYRHQLRMGQAMALAAVLLPAVLLPLASAFSGRGGFLPQTAQVWSAPTMGQGAPAALEAHRVAVSLGSSGASVPLDGVSRVVSVLFAAGLLVVLARLAKDAAATLRVIADAQAIRRLGSSTILASELIDVPFSFWLPARYYIVVPSALALRSDDLRMAIRHEAQHHRQQDTKWVWLHQLLEAMFFSNPAVHYLGRQLRELQEFSCDEALGNQRNISAPDYCECLLRVAEAATAQRHSRLHASMISGGAGMVLKRRVEALLTRPADYLGRSIVFITGGVALALMATTALAFASTIHDRRISADEARKMAAVAQQNTRFPIAANARVVRQLNLLLSTPDGRAYLQASLERMQGYEALLSQQLAGHGMPLELLAVPLAEAGYRNLPQDGNPRHGAGLWMFVAPTARAFGLRVDSQRDERLDVAAETGAAIRLFSSLHREFDDWGLALLAYNAGSARVERAIVQTGSRDVWTLIDRGYENDPDYVPRVMAAILILENPAVLD